MNEEILVHGHSFVKVIDAGTISSRLKELATQINADYKGKKPLVLGILNGAFMFLSDLAKLLEFEAEISFIRVSSYSGMQSSEHLVNDFTLREDVKGRDVLLVEDIIDTGFTMKRLLHMLEKKKPASVRIATFVFKPEAAKLADIKAHYQAFEMKNEFVVGYGLDYDGYGRHLPHVYQLKEKIQHA